MTTSPAEPPESTLADGLLGDIARSATRVAQLEADLAAAEAKLAAVEAVTFASDDGTEYEHNGHGSHEGEPECPGCWVETIRAALATHPAP